MSTSSSTACARRWRRSDQRRGSPSKGTEGHMKHWLAGFLFAVAAAVALQVMAQTTVTFAYQDMMNPWRWVQQSQEIEKATGYKINWRQFGGGGDVIRAMASGDIPPGAGGTTR